MDPRQHLESGNVAALALSALMKLDAGQQVDAIVQTLAEALRQRLGSDDLPAMAELARLGPLTAFTDGLLDHGPAFGAFADGRLVAMAGTHFATAEVIEIGHVVTHPDYRRRGFAAQVTSAVVRACFALAPRVYLMVVADNAPAVTTYRALGFQPLERFAIVEYRLMS